MVNVFYLLQGNINEAAPYMIGNLNALGNAPDVMP